MFVNEVNNAGSTPMCVCVCVCVCVPCFWHLRKGLGICLFVCGGGQDTHPLFYFLSPSVGFPYLLG